MYFFSSSPLAESRFILLHFPIESLRAWRQSSRARCSPRCPGWSSTNGKLGNGRHGAKFEFLVTPHAEREGSGRSCLISKTAHTGREPPQNCFFSREKLEKMSRDQKDYPRLTGNCTRPQRRHQKCESKGQRTVALRQNYSKNAKRKVCGT